MMPKLILASGSAARRDMLQSAGLEFGVQPADIDETSVITSLHGSSAQSIAAALAQAKALKIAQDNPDALVIGSDQILECEGQMFEKAKDADEARLKLQTLRGKTHTLISAVCVARGNKILFEAGDEAQLTMHDFDDAFLEGYIAAAGNVLTSCVGAYALEQSGAWLFNDIKGNYHTILGMPLLPLLGYLRETHGFNP